MTIGDVEVLDDRVRVGERLPVLLDEDSHVAQIYNPKKSAPLSVLIDKSGKIVMIREGYNPGDEEYLAKDVAKVLDGSGASK